tara:strand:- start:1656 stop:2432 length:777 start_codon:yes stop_codon:yes gene_type:complete
MASSSLEIKMFPCLLDNYGFLIHDAETNLTATIDTPEVSAIQHALTQHKWQLTHIINTHHHFDHAGGNLELKRKTDCIILGPSMDQQRIPGIDVAIGHREEFKFGNHQVVCYHTPGHTTGHVVYHFMNEKVAFVGDTLFAMGCGRLFEGTAEQMWSSLQLIMQWPDDTLLYCAHEYTQNNAEFALTVEPENRELIKRKAEVDLMRSNNQPTVPTKVGIEKKTNPFLRPNSEEIKINLNMAQASDTEVFAEIRKRKDNF